MFALVDCNNFYASCERVFNPQWIGKPIVILSNNDGCVIARSNEAKSLGIPMGAPFFQVKNLVNTHGVIVCSSNFTLYGDMSDRVMNLLKQFSPDFQIYSIDEAFFRLPEKDLEAKGCHIRKTILQCTGIPVSIGIAPTKTLAKVANHRAKKDPKSGGVYILDSKEKIDKSLETLPVTEIWGIGKQMGLRLNRLGIHTAKDYRDADDKIIRKQLTVVGLRIAWELRGTPCHLLNEIPDQKKSITCSRAFAYPIDNLSDLHEAVASYAARTGEKLRNQDSLASIMTVFIEHHPFRREFSGTTHIRIIFPEPTNYTPHLIHYAKQAASKLFQEDFKYRKAGIILDGFSSNKVFQQDLFATDHALTQKQDQIMKSVDALNERFGYPIVHTAAEGISPPWKMKQNLRTPKYTTCWNELLKIKI